MSIYSSSDEAKVQDTDGSSNFGSGHGYYRLYRPKRKPNGKKGLLKQLLDVGHLVLKPISGENITTWMLAQGKELLNIPLPCSIRKQLTKVKQSEVTGEPGHCSGHVPSAVGCRYPAALGV